MNITWKMKYNYYMRYKNNENIELIFNEIRENPNSNFENINQFINALNFWGPGLERKNELLKERTLKHIDKEIKKYNRRKAKEEKNKNNDIKGGFKNMDIKNYSKEETEQIIRIQRRMIEEYHKANYDKPKKEINYEIIKDEEKRKKC